MTISEFFDRLDEMLGAAKIAEIRAFVAPYRDQFEAMERDAKAKNSGAALKKLEAQNKALDEKNSGLLSELSKQHEEIERLQYDLSKFREKQAETQDEEEGEAVSGDAQEFLKFLVRAGDDGATEDRISQVLGIDDKRLETLFVELKQWNFVKRNSAWDEGIVGSRFVYRATLDGIRWNNEE